MPAPLPAAVVGRRIGRLFGVQGFRSGARVHLFLAGKERTCRNKIIQLCGDGSLDGSFDGGGSGASVIQ
jgi:hypothetical protein